jgi:hypothetical protein
MNLAEFRRRLLEIIIDAKKTPTERHVEYVEALARLENEMIQAVLDGWRPRDGGEGDRRALVRHPNAPKPSPNQSSMPLPLPAADECLDVNAIEASVRAAARIEGAIADAWSRTSRRTSRHQLRPCGTPLKVRLADLGEARFVECEACAVKPAIQPAAGVCGVRCEAE